METTCPFCCKLLTKDEQETCPACDDPCCADCHGLGCCCPTCNDTDNFDDEDE
jgi:hypothetical protein